MQPLKDKATLATLDLAAGLTQSDGALPLHLQAVLLFPLQPHFEAEQERSFIEKRTSRYSSHFCDMLRV
jgi:hypothetical protein